MSAFLIAIMHFFPIKQHILPFIAARSLSTTGTLRTATQESNNAGSNEWVCNEDSCISLPKEADVVVIDNPP